MLVHDHEGRMRSRQSMNAVAESGEIGGDDDRNDELEGSPIPDPEEEQGTSEDDPEAD